MKHSLFLICKKKKKITFARLRRCCKLKSSQQMMNFPINDEYDCYVSLCVLLKSSRVKTDYITQEILDNASKKLSHSTSTAYFNIFHFCSSFTCVMQSRIKLRQSVIVTHMLIMTDLSCTLWLASESGCRRRKLRGGISGTAADYDEAERWH